MLLDWVLPAVLAAVDPAKAVARAWSELESLDDADVLIAFGKASSAMAREALSRLNWPSLRGMVITRPEDVGAIVDERVEVLAADHPIPTDRNVAAAMALVRFCRAVPVGSRVLVLVSGGGSAQLSNPRPPLSLASMAELTSSLLRSGATIGEINAVRKHCEGIKGGQLACILHDAGAASVRVLVLSDVLGDRLDVISSGPFAPDPSTFEDALRVMHTRGVRHPVASDLLTRGVAGAEIETPKQGHAAFEHVAHNVLANNAAAVDAACDALAQRGINVVARRDAVEGEARDMGRELGRAVRGLHAGQAVVWGGETTVHVGSADGLGGRNQEFTLAAAAEIAGMPDACVLSLGTDGVDGPTPAAGGIVDGATMERLLGAGIAHRDALDRHDSHTALAASGDVIVLGPTGTNVNDLMIGIRLGR
jgi:glycerate-2-kinase